MGAITAREGTCIHTSLCALMDAFTGPKVMGGERVMKTGEGMK